jgi:hypothetical protein
MIVEMAFEETISNSLTNTSLQVDSITQSHHQEISEGGQAVANAC